MDIKTSTNKDFNILHHLPGKLVLEIIVIICNIELRNKYKHLCT